MSGRTVFVVKPLAGDGWMLDLGYHIDTVAVPKRRLNVRFDTKEAAQATAEVITAWFDDVADEDDWHRHCEDE